MVKNYVRSKHTAPSAADDMERVAEASIKAARSRMLAEVLSVGWRLAVALIVPLVIGVKLDKRFGTKPSYAVVGFVVAVILTSLIIYRTYQDIVAEQTQEDAFSVRQKKKGKL